MNNALKAGSLLLRGVWELGGLPAHLRASSAFISLSGSRCTALSHHRLA